MDKKSLEFRFSEYLLQNWKDPESLRTTKSRFKSSLFDIFFNWLDYLAIYGKNAERYQDHVFHKIVLPQMRRKIKKQNTFFKNKTYNTYKSLFMSFIAFAKENQEFINKLKFDDKKEKVESSLSWYYWDSYDKKAFIKARHDYIKTDTWENWEKFRSDLIDIYWSLSDEKLKNLYEIFFDSYEIFNSISNEAKWKEKFEKRDAFKEAFLNIKKELHGLSWETLNKISSLFWKYLHFVPQYRERLVTVIKWRPRQWKHIQKNTERDLSHNFWNEATEKDISFSNESEWDWPDDNVIERFRDGKYLIADIMEDWDVVAPIDNFWSFPDDDNEPNWENNKWW